jgi:hypothetical protein
MRDSALLARERVVLPGGQRSAPLFVDAAGAVVLGVTWGGGVVQWGGGADA